MLELVGAEPFKATLTEAPILGDETSARTKDELPAYVVFQGDGDVTAPLVYANYGMQEDYRQLERLGVSVRGKIVIARYGQGVLAEWQGHVAFCGHIDIAANRLRGNMGRYLLLWLLGIPIPILLLIWLFGGLH
jgi:hypothetical protein